MKLYTYDAAPNPRRLALFMHYKGIEIETEQIDMGVGAHLTDEFRAINAEGTLPALVLDDGTVLSQVIGQCTYLEGIHPEKPLLGTTPLEKAQVISWVHKINSGLTLGIASVFRNRSKGFINRALPGPLDLPQIPDLVDRGFLQIDYALTELDGQLANQPWVAGDTISMADIDLFAALGFLAWIKKDVNENGANLLDWRHRAETALT